MDLISVDIETTGLDPTRHEAWEVAIVPVEEPGDAFCYHFPVTLLGAEERALEIGGFRERFKYPSGGRAHVEAGPSTGVTVPVERAIWRIVRVLSGNQLLGCSVHFDASFLTELLRRHGNVAPPWHHRHLDLGSYAAGAWGAKKALSGQAMADRYPNPDAHDALADARWNVEVYNAIRTKQD